MEKEELKKTLEEIKVLANEVGLYQLEQLSSDYEIETKSGKHDIVTAIDKESEKRIVKKIKELFPNHNIVGEEDDYQKQDSDYCWYIDPIDGTTNFFKRIPYWSVSIGLTYKENPILGVIHVPYLKDTYYATKGGGAFRNKTQIFVSKINSLDNFLYATGFYYDKGQRMKSTLSTMQEFLSMDSLGVRRIGAASVDICMVAQGSFDAYMEHNLSPWDFMAGYIIVLEAGGKVTNFFGDKKDLKKGHILVTNGLLHDDFSKIVMKNFKNVID